MGTIGSSDSLVVAGGLRLFGRKASIDDLAELEDLAETSAPYIAGEASNALLSVLARNSPEQVIEWLKRPGSHRDEYTVGIVRSVLPSIGADALHELLDDRSPSMRRIIFEHLKDQLPKPAVRKLSRDTDGLIRAAAYMELVRKGEDVGEEEIEESVPEKERSTYPIPNPSADDALPALGREDILLEHYRRLPYTTLNAQIGWLGPTSPIKYEALSDRYFAEFKQTLRGDVEEDFTRLDDTSVLPDIDESNLGERRA